MTVDLTEEYRVVYSDSDHAKAVAHNMLYMVWRYHTTPRAYRQGMDLVSEIFAKHPEGVGVCQVVEVDVERPDEETRRLFVEFLRMRAVKHFAVLHDSTGFKAASVRAVIASVHALARPVCKHAVHATLHSSGMWHAAAQAELGRRETAADIEGAIVALRAFHRERFPSKPLNKR